MSVSIEDSPSTPIGVYNCIRWELLGNDAGTPPVKKYIGYYIFDSDTAEQLTETEAVEPKVTENQVVDFRQDCKNLVQSSIPFNIGITVTEDTTARRVIKLKYGEISVNESTCSTSSVITSESDPVTIISAALQPEDERLFAFSNVWSMTKRPSTTILCRGQYDWVKIITSSPGTLTVNGTDTGGAFNDTTALSANKVYDIPIGTGNQWFSNNPGEDVLSFSLTYVGGWGSLLNFNFVVQDCCTTEDLLEVWFLEPLGGYSSFAFNEYDIDFATSQQEMFYPSDCLPERGIMNKEGREYFTLMKQIPPGKDWRLWVRQFLASPAMYLRIDRGLSVFYERFVMEAASFPMRRGDANSDLIIRGYTEMNIQNPR